MAVKPAENEAFFREVDEELRREQLASVWSRYGRWIVAAVVLALAALGGFLYWQHARNEARAARAEQLSQALADLGQGREAPAGAALAQLTATDDRAYAVAARLTQAGVAQANGDLKAAAAGFDAVAADAGAPQPFRDLALVRGVTAAFDTLPPQTVIDRLKPLAVPGNAWFGSAGELTAAAWLKLNQPAKAGAIFAAIAKDETVPETLRARAVRISGMLGVDAVSASQGAAKG